MSPNACSISICRFSPSILCHLMATIPCAWILELHLHEHRNTQSSGMASGNNNTFTVKYNMFIPIYSTVLSVKCQARSGAHYQERDSPILGLAISTVAKVSIFRFPFSAKQTKGFVSDQSQCKILLRHIFCFCGSYHGNCFSREIGIQKQTLL